jgi:hypothetical protein
MNTGLPGGPGGQGRRGKPAGTGRWLAPARRNWYLAIMAAVALALITSGVAMLVQGHGTPTRQVASDCGLVNCGATPPGPITTTSPPSHISKVHRRASHAPAPTPSATPPSPTPSQAPAPPPDVTVSFTSERHRFDHFEVQLTIVNHGSSPVSGWTIQLTFPRDEIDFVESGSGWTADPFDHWQFRGDMLTLSADTGSETVGPGGSEDVTIHGRGEVTFPTGCTFNGTACQA